MNRRCVTGKCGGWTSISQVADSESIHGGLKKHVRQNAIRHFMQELKKSSKGKSAWSELRSDHNMGGAEWAVKKGSNRLFLCRLFEKFMPPLPGKEDRRRPEVKDALALYARTKCDDANPNPNDRGSA
jgi:hypothetical protein